MPENQSMKIAILLILNLILISCTNCYQTKLSPEEKSWCAPYKKGQTLIFKSDRGHFDTIAVTSKSEGYTNNDCNQGLGPEQKHFIKIILKPKTCHNLDYCESEIAIVKEDSLSEADPSLRIYGLEYDVSSNNYTFITEKMELSTIRKVYPNVYSFKEKINATNYGNAYLKSFYWDKHDGLIRYDLQDGEVFEFFGMAPN